MTSKSQIDKLGERLRAGPSTEADLRELDEYRRSFSNAYQHVVGEIRKLPGLEPTGRPAKSTNAIVEKLRRESIRLSQIQDIAGCRVIVPDIIEQDRIVAELVGLFSNTTVIDRRSQPSHGYRAVHLVARQAGMPIEIQVRTFLQHVWAELSEKFSDVVDPAIKYGQGDPDTLAQLNRGSDIVRTGEDLERQIATVADPAGRQQLKNHLSEALRRWTAKTQALIQTLDSMKG